MKQATCKELRGACDVIITGDTPEQMAENCKSHVQDVMGGGDSSHDVAIKSMMKLSKEEQQQWYEDFVANFDNLKDA